MTPELKWRKIRLDGADRSTLDRAVGALGRRLGVPLRLVRLAHGKLVACRVDDLWFCHVGDGGQPPQTWTVAVDTRPEPRALRPRDDPADFAECCDLLGLRDEARQAELRAFLTPPPAPEPNTAPEPTDPGAP